MHFKCKLCFFMCLWCHYNHVSTACQRCLCFHTETARVEIPHTPFYRQVTFSNYSSDQHGKTRAYRHLVSMQVVFFTHEHSPAGVNRMTCTEEGFRNRAQSKTVCSESNWCSHVTARDAAEASATATSALGAAAETGWGVTATKAPSLQQDGSPGLNFSI